MDALGFAAKLNELLLTSPEYSSFMKARDALAEEPRYSEMVNAFRRKQVEYETEKLNNGHDEAREMALANEYADICLMTLCNDFFQAEMALLELIKAVNARVWDGVEVGFD